MRKIKRDIVISMVDGKDLVGVYFADTNGSEALIECSPEKADRIIKIWNNEKIEYMDKSFIRGVLEEYLDLAYHSGSEEMQDKINEAIRELDKEI